MTMDSQDKKTVSAVNRRRYLRFKETESSTLTLTIEKDNEESLFTALILDESMNGIACVYVGPHSFTTGDELTWKETEEINTGCKVIRCKELMPDVHFMALELVSDN